MNAFLYSWYQASINAAGTTADKITDTVNVASPAPDKKNEFFKTLVIDSLLAGLAFLPGISTGGNILASTAKTIAKVEAPARMLMAASAPVYSNLFPHDGSAASNLIEQGELNTYLQNLAEDLTNRLSLALQSAINDKQAFLNLAETGMFSGAVPPSLPENTENLEQALTTYVVSVALSGSAWFVGCSPQKRSTSYSTAQVAI
ncbi:MAG: hypothetical protein Q9166_000800 [cf. Caloplaca sp. 2 TL-2023]